MTTTTRRRGGRTLGLAVLGEDARGDLVELVDVLEDRVLGDLLALDAELLERHEARVGLAQDGVAVTRDDLARVERLPDELDNLVLGRVVAELLLHADDEAKDLLVGEAVERAGQTAERGRVRQERVRKGRADEVSRVRRDVAALVVSVQRIVEADELDEALRLAEADLRREVVRQVLRLVDGGHVRGAVAVLVVVLRAREGGVVKMGREGRGKEGQLPRLSRRRSLAQLHREARERGRTMRAAMVNDLATQSSESSRAGTQ